ncbi:MAG: hypothetical protein GWP66_08135 [Gammaproteobacteria bacterium]|nr:hypothetical protein [Gammaproteobacteria bacterium]
MNEPRQAPPSRTTRLLMAGFCAINAALLFLCLMHLPFGYKPLKLAIVGWAQASPRIDIVFGFCLFLAVVTYHGMRRLPPDWKTRLLYFKPRFAHPAHGAFFSLKEPPFDRKPLLVAYPEIKDAAYHPDVQMTTWCKLLERHAEVPLVAGSQTGWHLLRDFYLIALVFLLAFLLTWPLNSDVNMALAFSYLFLFGVQTLFLMFSARGTARRLVHNVLAVELGIAGTTGINKEKKNKPGKAKTGKKQKRF